MLNDYLICAIWTSIGDDCEPLDTEFGVEDISEGTRIQSNTDILSAIMLADDACPDWRDFWNEQHFAHDLWLTRNGHGSGFWDRYTGGRGEEIGDILTGIAESMGNVDLYVGDDGRVYSA